MRTRCGRRFVGTAAAVEPAMPEPLSHHRRAMHSITVSRRRSANLTAAAWRPTATTAPPAASHGSRSSSSTCASRRRGGRRTGRSGDAWATLCLRTRRAQKPGACRSSEAMKRQQRWDSRRDGRRSAHGARGRARVGDATCAALRARAPWRFPESREAGMGQMPSVKDRAGGCMGRHHSSAVQGSACRCIAAKGERGTSTCSHTLQRGCDLSSTSRWHSSTFSMAPHGQPLLRCIDQDTVAGSGCAAGGASSAMRTTWLAAQRSSGAAPGL
eukprot:17933-Chlamydomonas_euryale.AAC.6